MTSHSPTSDEPPFETLPDLLAPGLRLVFVGINPSTYSVARGHYFARPTSRFWPAFSRSRLSVPIRAALGRDLLTPADDVRLPEHGFGFTDVVKRPSSDAALLRERDFAEWAPRLIERLAPVNPTAVCFHGVTAYRAFLRHGLGEARAVVALGLQPETLGAARIFVVPNPSPANAHFTPADQATWYDHLADYLDASRAST